MGLVTNATPLGLLAACAQRGVARERVLREAGLKPEQVLPEERLPQPALHKLWRIALDLSGDTDLAIHAAEATPAGAYGTLDFMMAHAPTLGAGLERVARYFPLIHTGVRLSTHEGAEECALDVGRNPDPEAARPAGEFSLAAFALRARQSVGDSLAFLRVECAYAEPQDRCELDRFFRSPLSFDAPSNRLVFSRQDWERAPAKAEPALFRVLVDHARRLEAELPEDSTWATRVTRILSEEVKGGWLTAPHVAKRLGLSERSLQRRLKEEGTAFTRILDEIRARYAAIYLKEKQLSQSEVAHLLGFSDLSAFSRAHRRWTGRPPGRG